MRARTANEMLRAFAHVREYGHLLWLPIYCHHGTKDKLASISVSPILVIDVATRMSLICLSKIQVDYHYERYVEIHAIAIWLLSAIDKTNLQFLECPKAPVSKWQLLSLGAL